MICLPRTILFIVNIKGLTSNSNTRIKRNILLIAITHNLSLSLLPFRSPKILHECFQINSSIERIPWAREHRRRQQRFKEVGDLNFLLRVREDFVIRNRDERKSIKIHHKVLEKLIGAWNFTTSCQSNKFRFSRRQFCMKAIIHPSLTILPLFHYVFVVWSIVW